MESFYIARKNMVDCQLAPNGVISSTVLDVFGSVSRERFLPEDKRPLAYLDEDILQDGQLLMMEPVVQARMLQAANIKPDDIVLNIGDTTGYMSAIFANLLTTVLTVESVSGTLDDAKTVWDDMDVSNIAVVESDGISGFAKNAPYSLIFMNGAVCDLPQGLLAQLTKGEGRLLCVERKQGENTGSIVMHRRLDKNHYVTECLFDAFVSYLSGCAPEPAFVF